ncbi:hypothetical protein VTK56DRAFT_9871 [Thermocarpiscus australiensis]
MDRLPNELYDLIVTLIHDDFCRCTNGSARPGIFDWDMGRQHWSPWDTQPQRELQAALCKLRLVDRRFLRAANRFLFSHGTLIFDFYLPSCPANRLLEKRVLFCRAKSNRKALGRVRGLRIGALVQTSFPCRQQSSLPACAPAAGGYPDLGQSITHLRSAPYLVPRKNRLTSLKLCLDSLCDDEVSDGVGLARFRSLSELGISNSPALPRVPPRGIPLTLHPQNRGLARLHLHKLATSAAQLIAVATRGGSPSDYSLCAARGRGRGRDGGGRNDSDNDSPLAELVLAMVKLGRVEREGGRVDEAGTWPQVFKAIGDRCTKLRSLQVTMLLGPGSRDTDELEKLAECVRSGPGARAYLGHKDRGAQINYRALAESMG